MKKLWLIAAVLQICSLISFAQDGRPSGVLAEKVKTYISSRTIEKAYLHFDKPYYAAGDTIYFKAYVTMGQLHLPSAVSGVLHVDLINTQNKVDQSIKLQLINGIAWGDFALPDSLPKGNYRVRAYTRWMRNEGDDSYFYQTIPVGTVSANKVTESSTRHAAKSTAVPDIRFFPEGGELIAGVSCKIAFKAVGPDGLGLDVKGIVIDNTGKEITSFASAHLGMGYFNLTPVEGKTYTANITYINGDRRSIDIPLADAKGISIQIDNDSLPKASVKIITNSIYFKEHQKENYTLMIFSAGKVISVNCKLDSPSVKFDILKRRLRTGVASATLFNSAGEPLSERLFFVKNYDLLKLNISTDNKKYRTREKVTMRMNAVNRADSAIVGNFSVSVINESKVSADENAEQTILTCLLLTSDLKGFIEQPNYYFNNSDIKTSVNLDLVMLTHGYRRFKWKQLLNNNDQPLAYQPEAGLEINGVAKNLIGRQLTHASVTLLPARGGFVTQVADEKGFFSFTNLLFNDSAKFILQAVNKKGGNNTKLIYLKNDIPPPVYQNVAFDTLVLSRSMTAYLKNHRLQQLDDEKYGSIKGRLLKEVKIKSFKPDNHYKTSSMLGAGLADKVLHADAIGDRGTIAMMLEEKGVGGTKYILDGVPVSVDVLNTLPTDIVETVELYKGANAAIFGTLNPVVVITTGRLTKLSNISSIGILPITIHGFYKAREFYTPVYDHTENFTARKDLRSTIFWQPMLVTDKEGNATFSYFNADGTGTYRVVVEGIDSKGNLGRQVYRYKVE